MAGASSVSHSRNVGEPFIISDANSNCNKWLSPTISDVLFGVLLLLVMSVGSSRSPFLA